ncbi:voltage-gated chloride channel family protein [Myroides indicus]|uniref:H+/Cl-antiporter ClcA n=1 Tax=Myroides indicus TaxID=1323422 RepID=A0A4R7EXH1_9FLAO|nr:H+/Cl- antiporter ClcA [Myroides indicus]
MLKKNHTFLKKLLLEVTLLFQKFPALLYIFKWLIICLIIGICVGTASAGFLLSLQWATDFRENHLWIIALLPMGGLVVGIIYLYYGQEVEAGNNLLIDNVHNPQKKIPFRMAPFVYLGTIVTHLFGGSAGREGTALQMAGAIADQFTAIFKLNTEERKVLLILAIASGFGSVFGTPLAGAVFGLEVYLIGKIKYNALFPAFIASILADWTTTNLYGVTHIHYSIDIVPSLNVLTIIYSTIAGVLFGICAAVFSKGLQLTGIFFKDNIIYPPFRPFVGGIIVALAVFSIGTTKYIGLGIPYIVESFEKQSYFYEFAIKMLFTIITLSTGFKGGEVTPLFYIGATLGSAASLFLPLPTGLLAGMGFVAVFAGATNTPLACILMGIELFGIESGIYIAIACITAYLFSGHNSIYSKQRIGVRKHTQPNKYYRKRISDIKKLNVLKKQTN